MSSPPPPLRPSPNTDPGPGDGNTPTELMNFANAVEYDQSLNPKEINWISDDIESKMAPYKPKDILLGDGEVEESVAEAAFLAIFAPTPGQTFVWVNQYQVEQATRIVASWYGFAISSSAQTIFCSCGKPHTTRPKNGPISDVDFHTVYDNDSKQKTKQDFTLLHWLPIQVQCLPCQN